MSWNYRIVKYANGSGYGLHEVYYDDNGKENGMTENPISFVIGDDEDPKVDLVEMLRKALSDASCRPIFEEPDHWQ